MSSGSEANHAPEGREEDRVAAILMALREDLGARGAIECRGCRVPGQKTPSEGMALTSKFSLTRNENLVVLGSLVGANKKMKDNETGAVAMATNHDSGDREVANTTTTTIGPEAQTTTAAGTAGKKKNKKKKKSAKKATLPAAVGAEKPTEGTVEERWAHIWELIKSDQEMLSSLGYEEFKVMLGRATAMRGAQSAPRGPVCGNPECGKTGHTLAVCPKPTCPVEGDMTGCFFCNTVNHDADDCAMMEWVAPATLVTHLITNRAGMPPWKTRIDWVALANDNWDLVCFTLLPLTCAFVRRNYVPGKRWEEVNGLSQITDPLFKNANRRLLKILAKKPKPLMEASPNMCYCEDNCSSDKGSVHYLFKNSYLAKYIPDMTADKEEIERLMASFDRELAASEMQFSKQMPKKVTKERKGRRAMKKEALAAAAAADAAAHAEESVAGPSQQKTTADKKDDSAEEDDDDVNVSDKLLELADEIDDLLQNLQNIVKS